MRIIHAYFSPNGETKKIANHFHQQLGGVIVDLSLNDHELMDSISDSLLILFCPVYSQQIPIPLRTILPLLKPKALVIMLTYGGFSYGNVLYDIKKMMKPVEVVGYAITPVKHAYIEQNIAIDFSLYHPIIERIQHEIYESTPIPYRMRNIFATFFEKKRTQYNFRLNFNRELCTQCGLCIKHCPTHAINSMLDVSDLCISCGHCVSVCPEKAIDQRLSLGLRIYMLQKQKTSVIVR